MSHRKRPVSKKNLPKPIVYSAKTEWFYGALVGAALSSVVFVALQYPYGAPIALGLLLVYFFIFSLLFFTKVAPRVRTYHRNFRNGALIGAALYTGLLVAMLILV